MYHIADWSTRKTEIATAFRKVTPLPAESDDAVYSSILDQMDIVSAQDLAILYAIIEDAIMAAHREERPSAPLEAFKDWVQKERWR